MKESDVGGKVSPSIVIESRTDADSDEEGEIIASE